MKLPTPPPDVDIILQEACKTGRFPTILTAARDPSVEEKYLHWHKLRFYDPPQDLSHHEWWLAVKLHRRTAYKSIPLWDIRGDEFNYLITDPISEQLHHIDQGAGGVLEFPDQITNPQIRDRYIISSLMEEAITSSILEGASTTRQRAREMIRSGRPPRDRSEQMIANNFTTMQYIRTIKEKPLAKQLVLDIHRLVTSEALDDPSAVGRFRRPDERVDIADQYGQVLHVPPAADSLSKRMDAMCDFANGEAPDHFLHPVLRAIMLHFWLAYDHPFVDGNGRTARALFYWSMLHYGYWLCEFISISQIILSAPVKYARAYLYTESDENDLTYFLLYHIEIIRRAVDKLHQYIAKKAQQLLALERELRSFEVLNHRQRAIVSHALRHPGGRYTIESHRMSHGIVYQTARMDLLDLVKRGLLDSIKIGKTWQFRPVPNLTDKLGEAS